MIWVRKIFPTSQYTCNEIFIAIYLPLYKRQNYGYLSVPHRRWYINSSSWCNVGSADDFASFDQLMVLRPNFSSAIQFSGSYLLRHIFSIVIMYKPGPKHHVYNSWWNDLYSLSDTAWSYCICNVETWGWKWWFQSLIFRKAKFGYDG